MDPRVQEMLDHHEIRKLLATYCHACDRADAELMASVYAGEDSFDDHGKVKAPGPEYARVMTGIILERTQAITHILGQSLIEVDGDTAKAETFFFALFQAENPDGTPRLSQLAGRFIDRLERIEGAWKIKHRTAARDTSITLKIEEDFQAANGLVVGSRDAGDPGVALMGIAHLGAAAN
jgi:ketosteroid isomerase-like protein